MKRGIIRVGGKAPRGVSGGYAEAPEGFIVLPIISRGKKPYNQLSPFFLGPYKDEHSGLTCEIFENLWQFSKVYEKISKHQVKKKIDGVQKTLWKQQEEFHAKKNSKDEWEIKKEWFEWRKKGFECKYPLRHPNGTSKNGLPIFSYFNGEFLSYIDARKKIYLPIYKELVRKETVYSDIFEQVKKGQNILLIDVDGPSVEKYPNGIEMSLKKIHEFIENPKLIFGHGFACACALLEDLESLDDNIETNEPLKKKQKK
eukprot:gene9052-1149_t